MQYAQQQQYIVRPPESVMESFVMMQVRMEGMKVKIQLNLEHAQRAGAFRLFVEINYTVFHAKKILEKGYIKIGKYF